VGDDVDVSVVVLSWEDIERTAACVGSLPDTAEIVVVDNGSSARIAEALRAMCAATGSRYVRSPTNLGYAKGMNLGVRSTTRSTVILANNDLVAEPEAVRLLAARLADPSVGAAFPTVRDHRGADRTEAGRFLTIPVGLGHLTGLALLLPALRITATPARADWFTGPFVAIRRATLDAVGGIDESGFFYAEDLRLCWAVRRQGLRLVHVAEAVVRHENDGSSRRRWRPEQIAGRQTREFIRATRELGGWRGRIAAAAYTGGVLIRAAVAGGARRRAMARGAVAGLRGARRPGSGRSAAGHSGIPETLHSGRMDAG
jgi:N-acetylglucosaminyl-diphospho-decaprenol L-rhamnosyltransferase